MRRVLLIFGIIAYTQVCKAQINYRDVFTFDYTWAMDFIRSNRSIFDSVCGYYHNDADVIAAIVFPELIRYNMVRNYFETAALNTLYVRYGSTEVDFSVGYFQIKPSFAERLEQAVEADTVIAFKYPGIALRSGPEARQERVNRLNDLGGALVYLNAFCDLMETRISPEWTKTPEGTLRYLATAYNSGFDLHSRYIAEWMRRSVFPYGTRSDARQYNYAEISLHYYQQVQLLKAHPMRNRLTGPRVKH